MRPSLEPEKTAPGNALTAADWVGLHGFLSAHEGCGVDHSRSPPLRSTAVMPPPTFGSTSGPHRVGGGRVDGLSVGRRTPEDSPGCPASSNLLLPDGLAIPIGIESINH